MKYIVIAFTAFVVSIANAQNAHHAEDYQIWHQEAGSPEMAQIERFDLLTFWIIIPITLFVLGLLLFIMIRFREKTNPKPSDLTHNTTLEVIWTVIPIIILIVIAIPSFRLLSDQIYPPQKPEITIKATGHQWYWTYQYQDVNADIEFDSRPIGVAEIAGSVEEAQKERQDSGKTNLQEYPRLLAVDNEMVVPVNTVIRILVTAEADGVIHAFAMPSFGLKMDGIPGRINEVFFTPTKTGLFYGQCSELCGKYHAYMPIAIRVVNQNTFDKWVSVAQDDIENATRELVN